MTASASRSAANRNRRHLPACGGQTASRLSRLERIKKQKSAAAPGQFSMHLPDQRWMNIDNSHPPLLGIGGWRHRQIRLPANRRPGNDPAGELSIIEQSVFPRPQPRRVLYIQGSELSPDDRSGGNAFRDRAAPGPCWLLQASLKSGVAPSQPGTGPAQLLGLLGRVPHRIRRRWRARWPRGRGRRHTIEAARESAAPSQIRERCRRHPDKHAGNSRRGTAGPGHATSGVRSRFPRDYFRSYCHRENVVLRRVGSGLEHVTGLTLESHQAKAREPVECA
jgi:hypothetical protein